MAKPLDLASTFVVIEPDQSFIPIAVTPTVYDELDARFDQFKGRLLVSSLDRASIEEVIHLQIPGSFAVVPKGIWHRARTSVPTTMLFVTPGEGTANRPI